MLSIFSLGDTGTRFHSFFQTFDFGPLTILDLIVVAVILYWIYRSLRETRAFGILYGIALIVLGYIIARALRLELLALLMANFLTLLFVAIPVLFQPELRRMLERLGRTRAGTLVQWSKPEYQQTINQVSEAARIMALSNTGALIVFKRTTGVSDLITSGSGVDALVSMPLLLNIFYDKAPLHDGAVIIDKDRIVTAGAMLPLSEREYGHTLGTRHRAAVGLTEQSDAVVLVVSEERGLISLVVAGKITPGISPDVLPQVLTEFLSRARPSKAIKNLKKKQVDPTAEAKPKAKKA